MHDDFLDPFERTELVETGESDDDNDDDQGNNDDEDDGIYDQHHRISDELAFEMKRLSFFASQLNRDRRRRRREDLLRVWRRRKCLYSTSVTCTTKSPFNIVYFTASRNKRKKRTKRAAAAIAAGGRGREGV